MCEHSTYTFQDVEGETLPICFNDGRPRCLGWAIYVQRIAQHHQYLDFIDWKRLFNDDDVDLLLEEHPSEGRERRKLKLKDGYAHIYR